MAFDWQGHRGARGLYPENTISGMEEALKYPITTLELDVVISKDNKVVVSHEPWMNEEICLKGGKKINLYKMNYEDIKQFDCGSRPHPRFPEQKKAVVGKPLLSELIKATIAFGKKYNVEIKSTPEDEKDGYQPEYKSFSDMVVKELMDQLPTNRFVVQSFDWRVLKYIHDRYPMVEISALSEEMLSPEKVVQGLGFTPAIYSPPYKGVTPTDVAAFHAHKMKLIPWTVNTVEEMNALYRMDVDGIITDFPNLIPQVSKKSCGPKKNLFEGKCVKIPYKGMPSATNPGWDCIPGYQQKRMGCVKIKIPKHAHFLPDGKTWVCDEGYIRYRGTCKRD